MSNFKAKIIDIQSNDCLNIVSFDFQGCILKMMSLELNPDITIGTNVILSVKPTNIALAKDFHGLISYSNQIKSSVVSIKKGKLLSSLNLKAFDTLFESIVTTSSLQRMHISTDDTLIAFIKASDLFIQEICDD